MRPTLSPEFQALPPHARARVLETAIARGHQQLWHAALGSDARSEARPSLTGSETSWPRLAFDFSSLLDEAAPSSHAENTRGTPALPAASLDPGGFQPMIAAAAARTGVPATTLTAIIDAEAARTASGSWDPASRNLRSSAAGLGQFLSSSWMAEAQRPGSFLNRTASGQGWLDSAGGVIRAHRQALLDLRYDARHAIEAVADFAAANLQRLKGKGLAAATPADSTRLAYLAHHLGPADAERFLSTGIDERRAGRLLAAQVGHADAARRTVATGSASAAHREWLSGYVARRVMR